MICLPTLVEAREQAELLTTREFTVYIYRLPQGFLLTLAAPHEVDAPFVEKLTGKR